MLPSLTTTPLAAALRRRGMSTCPVTRRRTLGVPVIAQSANGPPKGLGGNSARHSMLTLE